MSKILLCSVLSCLLLSPAGAACIPGQELKACADVRLIVIDQLEARATVSYSDHEGASTEQQSEAASVMVERSGAPARSNTVSTFVEPPEDAKAYFMTTRSVYTLPSPAGKVVKLAGTVTTIDGKPYIVDGDSQPSYDSSSKRWTRTATPVMLRTDLIGSAPMNGTVVTVQGVCRVEDDGQASVLPFQNSEVTTIER